MKASPQTTALIQGTGFYPSEREQPFYVQKVPRLPFLFCIYLYKAGDGAEHFFSKHLQISNNHRIFAADIKTLVL